MLERMLRRPEPGKESFREVEVARNPSKRVRSEVIHWSERRIVVEAEHQSNGQLVAAKPDTEYCSLALTRTSIRVENYLHV